MDDAGGVQRGHARDHRARVLHAIDPGTRPGRVGGRLRVPALRLDLRANRPHRRQLHREEFLAVGLADVEHAADVRVLDVPPDAQLAREPLGPNRIDRVFAPQDLQRHGNPRDAIERAQHAPAGPRPEHRLDLIAPGQHIAMVQLRLGRTQQHRRGRPRHTAQPRPVAPAGAVLSPISTRTHSGHEW